MQLKPRIDSVWIAGPSLSGKTTRLVEQFCLRSQALAETQKEGNGMQPEDGLPNSDSRAFRQPMELWQTPKILVFAANGDNRIELVDRIVVASQGQYPIQSSTPLGFVREEVQLFWPLLVQKLELKAQFPLWLRPENEQELATQLWRSDLDEGGLRLEGTSEYRLVRLVLDLLQLAAVSGTPIEDIPVILQDGVVGVEGSADLWNCMGKALVQWRSWCLERGLLTYGLVAELYWRYLLPDSRYQTYLSDRYWAVLADDVDEYPAIARDLFECLLDRGAVGAFTYHPGGAIRLGLNADPEYLAGLADRCQQVESLAEEPSSGLGAGVGSVVLDLVGDPTFLAQLPESVQLIQTTSRQQLLRRMASTIVDAVKSGEVEPQEIAAIAPGLDAIARYTLIEILEKQGIPVESLNDQRPLIGLPMIRSLLTLMALVYPHLGRLVDRDAVAEMLVVLSQAQPGAILFPTLSQAQANPSHPQPQSTESNYRPRIDPVRAGLLADCCFAPHPDRPRLLPVTAFPRWDRLGHQAAVAYEEIVQWLNAQQDQQEKRLIPNPVAFLDRAIQRFFWQHSQLPYDRIAALRELMETAQHYWEVDARLHQGIVMPPPIHDSVMRFIQLLRSGTVTADPFPARSFGSDRRAVTLATIFQYRASRRCHRWQFWLDAGSSLWFSGGAAMLFGAPCFLKGWSGRPLTMADTLAMDEERLRRILLDLLSRSQERIYLCHSELATNGQEQAGPLLSLVNASAPVLGQVY